MSHWCQLKRNQVIMTTYTSKKSSKEWEYFRLVMKSHIDVFDKQCIIDIITWKQWINNALKRAHGIFGEGIEYSFLKHTDKTALVKVSYCDRDTFSSAITTYISTDELVGAPLIVTIEQESSQLEQIKVEEGDKVWFTRAIENEMEDAECD